MDSEGLGNNRPGPGGPPGGGFPGSLTGSLPEYPSSTNYTIPGILHFIKHEWSRFEKERSRWEVQKTELQVSAKGFLASYLEVILAGWIVSFCFVVFLVGDKLYCRFEGLVLELFNWSMLV